MEHQPTEYEMKPWTEIQQWEQRIGGPLARIGYAIDRPVKGAGDKVFAIRAGGATADYVEGVVKILNDAACWTIPPVSVYNPSLTR